MSFDMASSSSAVVALLMVNMSGACDGCLERGSRPGGARLAAVSPEPLRFRQLEGGGVEFAILGPLQVRTDDQGVTLGAAKPRALLLRLLVDANRTVSADRLIEDLWEGHPPRTADQTLQGYVSQLRKVLGADRLVTKAGGYELRVEAGELDAAVFEAAVTEARAQLAAGSPAAVLEQLPAELDRWRGGPLADAGGAEWAAGTVARLEAGRLVAIESMIDAQLSLGAYVEAIAVAEEAIALHPLHERLWAQLMMALYHDGRQADALRTFQRLRGLLAEELGIEPSRELLELETRIVRQDPALVPSASPAGIPRTASSGTLTFLFTDLETSTRMWEEHPSAMADALSRHDGIVRGSVEAESGRVLKTTGDGTYAVFSDASAAVRAAIDAQRRLVEETWGQTGPLSARIAVHTGAAEERDGDYFGPTMNRTARLMSIAHGGQVLISQATHAIVRDAPDLHLLDLGEHRLRDLTRPERVYQAVGPGSSSEFPALRSLDVLATNLPVQLTSFVGREDELRRVNVLLAEHRAVTITGVGGVGKTRLALQVAGDAIADFADGAWVCELAAATDEESMLATVADALGAPPRSGLTLQDSIVEFLRYKDLLCVLDNCEHLLQPAAQLVDQVLRSSRDVRVLVTSREALDVDGEWAIPLRSMTVTTSDAVAIAAETDAVKLFVDRASTARTGFVLDDTNVAVVNTICRRLDGIPLAIELAAVRVVSMSPSEIAALLDERFRLLTGGKRMALERHQTLQAAVEWSYDLLDDRERAVFDRLAVFASSFAALAARGIVTGDDIAEWDVLDALDGLVRKSLLLAEHQDDGSTRYQLLETLRQFALDRLGEQGDVDHWRRRHAGYYAALMAEVMEGIWSRDEFVWRARLDLDLENVKAAIYWSIDAEEVDLLVSLVSLSSEEALVIWRRMGRPATRALQALRHLPQLTLPDRVGLLALASLEAYVAGDIEQSVILSEQSETLGVQVDVDIAPAFVLQSFGPDFSDRSQLRERAVAALVADPDWLDRTNISIARQSRLYSSLASYLCQSGGDRELAATLAERARVLAVASENPSTIAFALFAIGLLTAHDEPNTALSVLDECIALNPLGAATSSTGGALYLSALILARRGEHTEARTRLHRAIAFLAPRGRTSELDGGLSYAIEITLLLDEDELATVVLGAVLGGPLQNLRQIPVPADRTVPDVRALRDRLGGERFQACIDQGAAMTYDDLITWVLAALDGPELEP